MARRAEAFPKNTSQLPSFGEQVSQAPLELNTDWEAINDHGQQPEQVKTGAFCALAIGASFCTYFCMYGFRKPFTAGTFSGTALGGIDYKTVLVISQVVGYTLSKFIGIKVISEVTAARRAWAIALLIGAAELALVVFALVPPPWNFPALFVNGLALGMVFGLVLGFLEGRRLTEALSAGLCASFVLSSGVVKSVGRYLIVEQGISEYWMPALTGLIFTPPLCLSIWMLTRIPPPDEQDVALRTERGPLSRDDRLKFFMRFSVGLSVLIAVYVVLTILRSVRDDFAVEIWQSLGEPEKPEIFAQTETVVMIVVVALNAAAILVVRNVAAFKLSLGIVVGGSVVVLAASVLQRQGVIDAFSFMVLSGIGLYAPYIAFHTTVFERLIAASRDKANLGFLMYMADATGYLGYVAVMLYRTFGTSTGDMLSLYHTLSLVVSAGSILAICLAWQWFMKRLPSDNLDCVPK